MILKVSDVIKKIFFFIGLSISLPLIASGVEVAKADSYASVHHRQAYQSLPLTQSNQQNSSALASHAVLNTASSIKSPSQQVELLTQLSQKYKKLLVQSWPMITTTRIFKVGDHYPQIPVIRQRLAILGDLMPISGLTTTSVSTKSLIFDQNLSQAIRHFQMRNGLDADGVIGPKTLAQLNVTPSEMIHQLNSNIHHWQKLPSNLGSEYIWVNIPAFELDVIKNNQIVFNMRTIVGKTDRPTPELTSKINTLVLNPEWTIPDSIIKKDIVPKMQADPSYLDKKNIRVFSGWSEHAVRINPATINWTRLQMMPTIPYRFTQMSGKNNALGQVKFSFSNSHSIYLHDTPDKSLFNQDQRAQSSGCVRLQEPFKLMEYLVNNHIATINLQQAQKYLQAGKTKYIVLTRPLPIDIAYITAWVDGAGNLQLRRDIYQQTAAH